MPCYSPNIVRLKKINGKFQFQEFYNSKNKLFPGYEYFEKLNDSLALSDVIYLKVPCRQCVGCVESSSRDWAIRCMLEAEQFESNWFITLTYDDEFLPHKEVIYKRTGEVYCPDDVYSEFGTLDPKDLEEFTHSLRDHFRNNYDFTGIRFFACGEYGGTTRRPHYHGIYFNLPLSLDDLKVLKITSEGNILYRSQIIESIWKKGFCTVANVNYQTCAYTARYVQKKLKEATDYEFIYSELGQYPEFLRMSRMPGIGKAYFEAHKHEIYANDEIIFKGAKCKVYPMKPPHYFDNLYGIDSEDELKEIKAHRQLIADMDTRLKNSQSTYTEAERLKIEERTKLDKFTALKRDRVNEKIS